MIMGAMLINEDRADLAICGAVDFPLTEPIVAGFGTMGGAFVPKEGEAEQPPQEASRPFSRNRRGFVVSEGSGCIVIAKKSFARAHGLAIAAGDLNGDGWTDIYIGNDFHENDYLYINQQDGTFKVGIEASFLESIGAIASIELPEETGEADEAIDFELPEEEGEDFLCLP